MNSHRQALGGEGYCSEACLQDASGDGMRLGISALSSSCVEHSVPSMENFSVDVTGVSNWVLLQIAIGVLVAASWCYVRRNKKVKGGQPRLSVEIDAVIESPAAIC